MPLPIGFVTPVCSTCVSHCDLLPVFTVRTAVGDMALPPPALSPL